MVPSNQKMCVFTVVLLGEQWLLDPRAEHRDRTGVGVTVNRFIWCKPGVRRVGEWDASGWRC